MADFRVVHGDCPAPHLKLVFVIVFTAMFPKDYSTSLTIYMESLFCVLGNASSVATIYVVPVGCPASGRVRVLATIVNQLMLAPNFELAICMYNCVLKNVEGLFIEL